MRSAKWVWVAVAVGLLALGAPRPSEAGVVTAVTQQGKRVEIDVLQYGRVTVMASGASENVGEDSEGGQVQRAEGARLRFQATSVVPLKVGTGFGYRMKVPAIAEGDLLTIDVVVTLPSVSIDMTVDRSEVRGSLTYDAKSAGDIRNITWVFSENNTRYHKTGAWTLSIYNAGAVLVTRPFQVVAE